MSRLVWIAFVSLVGCKGVGKQDWIDRFEPQVVDAFCKPEQAFRVCFSVDEAGCKAEAKKTVHACIDKLADQLPAELDSQSGREYGGRIGECAGNAYEADMRAAGKFKEEIAKCHDPSAWAK